MAFVALLSLPPSAKVALLVPALLVPVAPALADEKVTNFGKPAGSAFFPIGHAVPVNQSGIYKRKAGIPFTTGSNALGYDLNSIKLKFLSKVGNPKNIKLLLRSDSGGSPAWPAISDVTFTGPSSPVSDATYELNSSYRLAASTTYWITLETADLNGENYFRVYTTSSTSEDKPDNNDTGWSIGNSSGTWTSGGSWQTTVGNPLYLSVDADSVAISLAASSITTTGATLTISEHSGNWYYKQMTPSAGNCSSVVSATSAMVSSLTAGNTYTFKAYSNSSCTTELATTSFTTKPAQVTGVTAAARDTKLAVSWAEVTGATSYKIQWKSGAQNWDATNRQTTATTTSKTLESLTNSTQYTIQVAAVTAGGDGAWSNTATGTPADETLTVDSNSITATGATLTIGNYSGDW